MKWTVGRKNFTGFGLVVLGTAALVVFGLSQWGRVSGDVARLDDIAKKESRSKTLQLHVANLWQFFTDASLTKDPDVVASEAKPQLDSALAEIKVLKELSAGDPELLRELDEMVVALGQVWETGNKMFLAYGSDWDKGNEVMEEYDRVCDRVIVGIDKFVKKIQQQREIANDLVRTRVRSNKNVALTTGAVILMLSIMTGLLLTRSVTKPLSEMTRVAAGLARGVVDQNIQYVSSDEIGQ
jgi:methyl-accepting chemotaxis protein